MVVQDSKRRVALLTRENPARRSFASIRRFCLTEVDLSIGNPSETDWKPKTTFAQLALQLLFRKASESMGNHDSKIVGAGSVD
jgi:hypothetical protein